MLFANPSNLYRIADADVNAAINISTWGRVINRPEESNMVCSIVNHFSGSKPIALA
jgi:transposase